MNAAAICRNVKSAPRLRSASGRRPPGGAGGCRRDLSSDLQSNIFRDNILVVSEFKYPGVVHAKLDAPPMELGTWKSKGKGQLDNWKDRQERREPPEDEDDRHW